MKQLKGSITIFFVFSITLIISLVLSVTEIARINCQKLYLQIATDASIDSMSSLFHRKLYEYYNLYGVEYKTDDLLTDEYLTYLMPFFIDNNVYINNWYISSINKENVNLSFKKLTDDIKMEKEILSYIRYKLVGKIINFLGKDIEVKDEEDFDNILNQSKELIEETDKSSIYSEIHKKYFDFKDSIKTLENYAKKIQDYVDKVNLNINYMRSMSTSGTKTNVKAVSNKMDDLNEKVENLNVYLYNYKNKMSDFRKIVNESYSRYLNDKNSNKYDFDEEICEFIESEFDNFLSYVDEESPMNEAIDEGFNNCSNMKEIISEDKNELNAYVYEIEALEEELKEARKEKGEDKDTEYIKELVEDQKDLQKEISDYIKDLKETYKELHMEPISIVVTTSNHTEEERLIDKLVSFKDGILINLVMDNEKVNAIDKNDNSYTTFNIFSNSNSISVDKLLLGEYELDKFNYYNKELNDEITKSNSKSLEVERLISGKSSDIENIKSVINKILLIRIAMNVLHIYKSGTKRRAVRTFVNRVFVGFSPLMAEIISLLIIQAWGVAQSISDIKQLLNNKRVKFMHTDDTWTMSIDNILNTARQNDFTREELRDNEGLALNYKDYLRLLLLFTDQVQINGRMASIVELNIKKEQENFDFNKLIYSFNVENNFTCRHFFTNFTFVDAKDVTLYNQYKISCSAYRCFYEDK